MASLKEKIKDLYTKMVTENAPAEYIAKGWAIGIFWGCFCPFGLQLLFSIPTSFILHGSKIGATLGTLITNHFTIFLIYPVQCYFGSRILGNTISYAETKAALTDVIREQSYEALINMGTDLAAAFMTGGLIFALIMTPITYFGVKKIVLKYRKGKNPSTI